MNRWFALCFLSVLLPCGLDTGTASTTATDVAEAILACALFVVGFVQGLITADRAGKLSGPDPRPRTVRRPSPGPTHRDIVLLRSLALAFAGMIGVAHLAVDGWVTLASPAVGAALFFVTYGRTRGSTEHGDPLVPLARVR